MEASYDGPRINEETKKIDLPFVQALVERFKDQKKIHKKYAFMVRSSLYNRLKIEHRILIHVYY